MAHRGADVLVCLGDVVGYGPRPMEVIDSILEVTTNILMGNHDAAAIGAMDCSIFNDRARHSTEWTAQALTEEARSFLANLPMAMESEGILFVHAEACEPERFGYVNGPVEALGNFLGTEQRIIFLGHTHIPKVFEWDGAGDVLEFDPETRFLDPGKRYIVNVGSVGEPRDPADLRARYVIYDTERALLEFHAVDFDISACRDDLESTNLGLKPFFLLAFEDNAVQSRENLPEEAPAGHLLRPFGTSNGRSRVQLVSPADNSRGTTPPGISASGKRKRSGVISSLVLSGLLLLAGGVFWHSAVSSRGNEDAAKADTEIPSSSIIPEPVDNQENVMSAPSLVRGKPDSAIPAPAPSVPDIAARTELPDTPAAAPKEKSMPESEAGLSISVVSVGDRVPALDNSLGNFELAFNFGFGGAEITRDGIKFRNVTHALLADPVYGTEQGITVKGSSGGKSPFFNVADLGEDLWQTITYTDRGDDLRLNITGLLPEKRYLIQVLLGEPRNNKTTLYENGLISVTDASGSVKSTRLTFGNRDGDYALLRIGLASSDSLLFEMPKAGLGPGVSGIVIHSAPSSVQQGEGFSR
jgi:diadenosine tetraphosphatase ApaH/serine/threonine PP2A family protein phosphatase